MYAGNANGLIKDCSFELHETRIMICKIVLTPNSLPAQYVFLSSRYSPSNARIA